MKRLLGDRSGVMALEYAMIAALVLMIVLAAFVTAGGNIERPILAVDSALNPTKNVVFPSGTQAASGRPVLSHH